MSGFSEIVQTIGKIILQMIGRPVIVQWESACHGCGRPPDIPKNHSRTRTKQNLKKKCTRKAGIRRPNTSNDI